MSPILVRPVREQFEHDRVIRALQARYKRKYEVVVNPGAEQNAPVEAGDQRLYPDLVLYSPERGRKLQGTVEVETTESVNTLEALAQWAPLSRLRAPLFLYVPLSSIDTVRRLCQEHGITPAEIWTYHSTSDQVRFTMVHQVPEHERQVEEPKEAPKKAATVRSRAGSSPRAAKRTATKTAKSAKTTKTTRKTAGRGAAARRSDTGRTSKSAAKKAKTTRRTARSTTRAATRATPAKRR